MNTLIKKNIFILLSNILMIISRLNSAIFSLVCCCSLEYPALILVLSDFHDSGHIY